MPRYIVFDREPLALMARQLLLRSPIADKVEVMTRPHLISEGVRVTEMTDVTSYRWSTGEEVLWDFLTALAGSGSVNLAVLAGRYARTDLGAQITEALAELMGVPPMGEPQPEETPTGRIYQVSGTVSASSGVADSRPLTEEEQVLIENVDLNKLRLALEGTDGLVTGE
jgi:hypothetical protein